MARGRRRKTTPDSQDDGSKKALDQKKSLKFLIAKLHGLAGLRGMDSDGIFNKVQRFNPLLEDMDLYETIQAKGLTFIDGETKIVVPITRHAKITGSPLWKTNLLREYENDKDGSGIISEWVDFIMPLELNEETQGDENDDPDGADDPDFGVPPEA